MHTNKLIDETSPYLLQHAHNPVDWNGWNENSLRLANEQKKLIVVSIGYAACHWCHVMEHESFEDSEVAQIMNEHYISIKVDREERPDVDQVYMDAAQLITGRGGWPLNVITLPDGRPIYAGTYFTKEQWIKVLLGVQDFYLKTPEKAIEQAMQIAAGVNQMNYSPAKPTTKYSQSTISSAAGDWLNAIDIKEGGRAGQMKFPMPGAYLSLLRYSINYSDSRGKDLVLLTLDKMASGGIFDQLGGGFSRYSVDPLWHVPHFEKMLYDNAQLITLYSEAYKLTKDPFYKQIIEETISFCRRELSNGEGGYYSSIDADSEDEEGKFYVWTNQEIDKLLGEDADLFKRFYGVTQLGNWEHEKNVLKMSHNINELSEEFDISLDDLSQRINQGRQILFLERENRIRPALDDKTLTSWNALMITGLAHAYEALGVEQYRDLAIGCGEFIIKSLSESDHLKRTYKKGKASINGFLDDYAFTIAGFLCLYRITFNTEWIIKADELTKKTIELFKNEKSGLFNFKSTSDHKLFVEKQIVEDNVIPAGNSEMAKNLFILGKLLDKAEYLVNSEEMVLKLEPRIKEHAAFYYNWFDQYRLSASELSEIAIVGNDYESKLKEMANEFLPTSIILGGKEETLPLLRGKIKLNETLIYVCVDKLCKQPKKNVKESLLEIKQFI